jgi:cytochrome c biogenesis protein
VLTKVIEVNHPLRYDGYSFYQSDWRQARGDGLGPFRVRVANNGGEALDKTLDLQYRKRTPVGDGQNWVEIRDYYPDFFIGADRKPGSRSAEPRNPAIRLAVFAGETDSVAVETAWAFQKFPDAHMGQSGRFQFRFVGDLRPVVDLTGLQVSKAPGTLFIWLGITLSSLGLMLAFFVPYRHYLFYMEPAETDGRWVLNLSGRRIRGSALSRRELSPLIDELSERLSAERPGEG